MQTEQEWIIHKNSYKNLIFYQYGVVFENFYTVTTIVPESVCLCVCAIEGIRPYIGLGSQD